MNKHVFASLFLQHDKYRFVVENDYYRTKKESKLSVCQSRMVKQFVIQVIRGYWQIGYSYTFNNHTDIHFPFPIVKGLY